MLQGQLREVKYKEYMDIQSVHPLWSGWLGNRRELPPTAEDIRHFEREQAELKEKVAELEEQYKKEKLEERATRSMYTWKNRSLIFQPFQRTIHPLTFWTSWSIRWEVMRRSRQSENSAPKAATSKARK